MIIKELLEQELIDQEFILETIRVDRTTTDDELQDFADLYNTTGQLSWQLNPSRIQQKLGPSGSAFTLYDGDTAVGTVGIKTIQDYGHSIGEVGYLYLTDAYKNINNLFLLYNAAMEGARNFDVVVTTTNVNNRVINTLLTQSTNFEKIFMNQSQYSSNKLFVWLANKNSGNLSREQQIEQARDYYSGNIIEDYTE